MSNLIGAMYPIAQEFTALGYAVIPIHYRTKEAKVKWAPYQECLPIPVFESLDQVLPPEILERRESAVFLAQDPLGRAIAR